MQVFAYCGAATCDVLTTDTAICGCKIYRGRRTKFKLDWTTGLLIDSVAYRKAVMSIVNGNTDRAKTLICDAISDGSLYSKAYYTTRGSTSLDTDRRLSDFQNVTVESSSSVKASCMGAPRAPAFPLFCIVPRAHSHLLRADVHFPTNGTTTAIPRASAPSIRPTTRRTCVSRTASKRPTGATTLS